MHSEKDDKHKKDEIKKPLLTKRETAIVILICKEYSNKQIAAELSISPYTVESHKKTIRNKTGSYTVVGVVLYATRNNIFLQALLFILSSLQGGDFPDTFFGDAIA
ncbi:MAG: response regulator transcription factor [Ginsengibacter sp.]